MYQWSLCIHTCTSGLCVHTCDILTCMQKLTRESPLLSYSTNWWNTALLAVLIGLLCVCVCVCVCVYERERGRKREGEEERGRKEWWEGGRERGRVRESYTV